MASLDDLDSPSHFLKKPEKSQFYKAENIGDLDILKII
jgi:hypothetical protein